MNTNYSYVIADHIRAASFVIADGVLPSPKQRGYVLRRLIRRAMLASTKLGIDISNPQYFVDLVAQIVDTYRGVYTNLEDNQQLIIDTLVLEAQKFLKARESGKKEWVNYFNKNGDRAETALTTKAWDLYQSFGVPFEISEEQIETAGLTIDTHQLHELIQSHQQKSSEAATGLFKSGVQEDTEKTRKLHTTTHLVHAVLRTLLGSEVRQVGSAITNEKARFDFTTTQDISPEQESTIIRNLNSYISTNALVTKNEMTEQAARELGAIGLFGEKYPSIVSVYSIITPDGTVLSREFCGGPHVTSLSELGTFELIKIKSIGQGRKRIEFTVV
jgi:alanyl-tRNA synthetase